MVCFGLSACVEAGREEHAGVVDAVEIAPQSPNERLADEVLEEIHQKWMGTRWAYSGTSQVAGTGAIACGYFVTTTLREAGMEVDRVRLAQAASETMILEITPQETVRRFSDRPLSEFLDSLRRQGEGYYIVGLDQHTGFLRVERDGVVRFIHSGPGRGVVSEAPESASELSASRYRVTGKIVWGAGAEGADAGTPVTNSG